MSLDAADIKGFIPNKNSDMLDRIYMHSGNGKDYITISFVWMGELDEWGLLHAQVQDPGVMSNIRCIRSMTNFFGDCEGVPRFVLFKR